MTPTAPREANLIRVDGKVALVTGGYGGIGQAVCSGLGAIGARVAVAGHNPERAAACAEALRQCGYDAYGATFDALSPPDVERMVDEVANHFGRLDILVDAIGGQQEEKAGRVIAANFDSIVGSKPKQALL